MLMQGTVTQASADDAVLVTRTTGARQSSFEGILPAYMRLALTFTAMIELCITIKPVNWVIDVEFRGKQSGIKLIWRFGHLSGDASGTRPVDGILEWYVPDIFPVLFDEEWELALDSQSTGCHIAIDYTMYYSIVQSDEMSMVKTIADY